MGEAANFARSGQSEQGSRMASLALGRSGGKEHAPARGDADTSFESLEAEGVDIPSPPPKFPFSAESDVEGADPKASPASEGQASMGPIAPPPLPPTPFNPSQHGITS